MKHGRKEQLSITISQEIADDFYDFMEERNFLYKNQAFEALLRRAFLSIEFNKKYEEYKLAIFKRGFDLAADIAIRNSKSKVIKKQINMHYSALPELLSNFSKEMNIP